MVSRHLQRAAEAGQAHGAGGEQATLRPVVVAKIAGMAARDVEGVSLSSMPGIISVVLRAAPDPDSRVRRAVRARLNGKQATVDLWLKVVYGPPISKLVSDVRQAVRRRLSEIADIGDARINVHVTDMLLPSEDERPETT